MSSTVEALRAALGPKIVRVAGDIEPRHLGDWVVRSGADDAPIALTLPNSTNDVSEIVKICNAHRTPMVPQGGLTGLVGGGTPVSGSVLISLERMCAIEEIDRIASTITVQAGVPLQKVQEAADAADLLYPLDIGGRGSCLIGGNISTNAGGNRVLRYGMTRDLVLGLEVVLADGTIMTSLNKMLKNNAGYDLKHLFIGAEGTLGIVTRAVLRLFPKPRGVSTALCSFAVFEDVYEFLNRSRGHLGHALSAFEVMWPAFYGHAVAARKNIPISTGHAAYVLIETMGTNPEDDAANLSRLIETALGDDVVLDGVIAKSLAQTRDLWSIRDASGELVRTLQPLVNFDVSIETGRIDAFVKECTRRLQEKWPSSEAICFGHLADSNLHMFVKASVTPFPEQGIEEVVYGCVRDWDGSISAEHGIGILKKPYLSFSRTAAEIKLMMLLKSTLDPFGLLNPGKIFQEEPATSGISGSIEHADAAP